jgi:signal transduction histidine kinase
LAEVVENVNEISHELYNRSGESNNARITRTVEAARTIAGVVEDASELLRAGAEQPDWDVVDLHLLVYDLFEEIRQWYPQISAVLQADGLPKIRTYRNRLRRVMRSVLSNAFKFHSGNELAVQVEATVESGEACLMISDNGCGIPAKDVPRVFEYGYAVSDGSVHRPGTGLGLSLTRELLRAIGGDMELDSMPNEGTRVTVRIPMEAVE